MDKCLVIIPTYNEKENIEAIIRAVWSLNHFFEVLIIDDGSPDGTAAIVKQLQTEMPQRLHLIERAGKLGLGTAYIAGFRWALANSYDFIFEMDADFSHNPEDLSKLYFTAKNTPADLVIGSRYVNGVNVVNWPMSRVLMSYFASHYVRFITGMPISDTTAGFKCYRSSVLKTIDLEKIRFIGYAFQIEMKFLAWRHGFKLAEVPIIFTDRTRGQSKMTKGIFREAMLGVLQMKIDSLFRRYQPAVA
jgi:dolichol-phosphate mannosyltransferase